MILSIDASSARSGGGLHYLSGLLGAADPQAHGFDRVRIWSSRESLDALPDRPWLERESSPLLEGGLFDRIRWQRREFPVVSRESDLYFVPGGTAPYDLHPLVSVSQNILPFDTREIRRYGISAVALRLAILRHTQTRTFARSDGVIFLSRHAERVVGAMVARSGRCATIAHGVDEAFRSRPRVPRSLSECSRESPMRLLYVSILDLYKHPWNVAEAVARLRARGMPVEVEFVGPAYPPAQARLEARMRDLDPAGEFLHYRGPCPHADLPERFADCDLFVFASTCENLPIIMIEAMASGCAIAASQREPMPEVLGDGGTFFDPEDVNSIDRTLTALLEDPSLREGFARRAFERGAAYSWTKCAQETFGFAAEIARGPHA